MYSELITVSLLGEESRHMAKMVQEACEFNSKIYIECGDKKVNAKSIMGVMSLTPVEGDKLTIEASGNDEEEAVKTLKTFF